MTPVPLQQPAGSFGREGFQPNGGYIQGHRSSEAWGEVIGGAPCWRPWQSWAGWCPFVLLHQALLPGHPVRMSCVLQDLHLWKPCWVSIRILLWSKWGVIPVQTVFHFQKLPTDQCQGDGLVVWWGAKDSFFFFKRWLDEGVFSGSLDFSSVDGFLKSKVSAGAISCAANFSIWQGMLSRPPAFRGFRFCRSFLMPLMEISMSNLFALSTFLNFSRVVDKKCRHEHLFFQRYVYVWWYTWEIMESTQMEY